MNVNVIYQRYLKAFKKGVYNYIKEEPDPMTQEMIPRKYFSGGEVFMAKYLDQAMTITDKAQSSWFNTLTTFVMITAGVVASSNLTAQTANVPASSSQTDIKKEGNITQEDFIRKYGIGGERLKAILSPEDFKDMLDKDPNGLAGLALNYRDTDKGYFDAFVQLMGLDRQPARFSELQVRGFGYDLMDVLIRMKKNQTG